jgi:hypothetical protein
MLFIYFDETTQSRILVIKFSNCNDFIIKVRVNKFYLIVAAIDPFKRNTTRGSTEIYQMNRAYSIGKKSLKTD